MGYGFQGQGHSDRPHLHHIDERADNNEVGNLLPLCPNCHLRDQHNPTRKVDIKKLSLFRNFKDPAILKPQFDPLFTRMEFLISVELSEEPVEGLERQAEELIELVGEFEMGTFYSKRLRELIGPKPWGFMMLNEHNAEQYLRQQQKRNAAYRLSLQHSRPSVELLVVEQLKFQPWANEA